MRKNIYMLGVTHGLPALGNKEHTLINPAISPQIIEKYGFVLTSPRTLIISEDMEIPSEVHACKCGACKAVGESRMFILKKLFGVQHADFLETIQSSVVIADKRGLPKGTFLTHLNVVRQALKDNYISVSDMDKVRSLKRNSFKSPEEMIQYLLDRELLIVNKSGLRELFSDYLKSGVREYCKLIRNALEVDCESALLRSLDLHVKDTCPACVFDNLVIIAGALHTKNIHDANLIQDEYVYDDYGFSEGEIKEEYKEAAYKHMDATFFCFTILLTPNEVFWNSVIAD